MNFICLFSNFKEVFAKFYNFIGYLPIYSFILFQHVTFLRRPLYALMILILDFGILSLSCCFIIFFYFNKFIKVLQMRCCGLGCHHNWNVNNVFFSSSLMVRYLPHKIISEMFRLLTPSPMYYPQCPYQLVHVISSLKKIDACLVVLKLKYHDHFSW